MCGIAGFLLRSPHPDAEAHLNAMADVLAHRGPDGQGFYLQCPDFADRKGPDPDNPGSGCLTPEYPGPKCGDHDKWVRIEQRWQGWQRHGQDTSSGGLPTHRFYAPLTPEGAQVGLANRRLAIVDRAHGHQPLFNESCSIVVVFNGEIYNYRDLRTDLRKRGHQLSSEADSEILPHLYEEYGLDGMLERLDGMFAFVLWDNKRRTLTLARDRFGEKPLYYAAFDWGLLFASELKGLLVHPRVPRRVDPGSMLRYLFFEALPSPRTIYQQIHQLEPGSYLRAHSIEPGNCRVSRYHSLPTPGTIERVRGEMDAHRWIPCLATHLERTVVSRLTGEVPIGVLLSGGLDSGLITALVARRLPDLHTFSLGFQEPSFDETEPAIRVARFLKTRHHPLTLRAGDLEPLLNEIQGWLDEPLADGSLVPTYALCKWVRQQNVGVVLAGEGGDEVFGGYPTYRAHRLDPLWDRIPPELARYAARAAGHLPSSYGNISADFVIKRTLAGLDYRGTRRHAAWMGGIPPRALFELLTPEFRAQLPGGEALSGGKRWSGEKRWPGEKRRPGEGQLLEALFSPLEPVETAVRGHRWPERAQIQDIIRYLGDDLLTKVDRASMAVGLEVRAPFLEHSLVGAGLALPPNLKVSVRDTKIALRMICRDLLPPSIVARPKKGFGMPAAHWLRTLEAAKVREWLEPPAGEMSYFRPEVVARWLSEHRSGRRDLRKWLWPVLMFERWRKGPWGPG